MNQYLSSWLHIPLFDLQLGWFWHITEITSFFFLNLSIWTITFFIALIDCSLSINNLYFLQVSHINLSSDPLIGIWHWKLCPFLRWKTLAFYPIIKRWACTLLDDFLQYRCIYIIATLYRWSFVVVVHFDVKLLIMSDMFSWLKKFKEKNLIFWIFFYLILSDPRPGEFKSRW